MNDTRRTTSPKDSARWCDRCEAFGNHHTDRHLCPECNGYPHSFTQVDALGMSHRASCGACNGTGYQPSDGAGGAA